MKTRVVPALAALFLIWVSGTGLRAENTAGPSGGMDRPVPETVQGSCGTIAAILAVYPTLEVRKEEGPFRSAGDGAERPGCRVLASGPARGIVGEVPPGEAVRNLLQQSGWKEDPRRAADGPGATSFALRKNGILCVVSGGARSGTGGGRTLAEEMYDLEARCAAE